jgi:hypothetical protein
MSVYGSGGGDYSGSTSMDRDSGFIPAAIRPKVRFDVIGESCNLLTKQLGVWFVSGLLFVMPVLLVLFVAYGTMFAQMMPLLGMGRNAPGNPDLAGIQRLFYGVSIPVGVSIAAFDGVIEGSMVRMAFRQMRGETIAVGDLFKVGDVIWPLMIVGILQNLAVHLGTLFCYVPGFILGGIFLLAIPLVTERRMSALAAVRESIHILRADIVNASLFFLLLSLVCSLGLSLCGIGVAFTFPLLPIAMALIYRDFFQFGPTQSSHPTVASAGPSNPWTSS